MKTYDLLRLFTKTYKYSLVVVALLCGSAHGSEVPVSGMSTLFYTFLRQGEERRQRLRDEISFQQWHDLTYPKSGNMPVVLSVNMFKDSALASTLMKIKENRIPVNAIVGDKNQTLLHIVTDPEIVQLLIDRGARIDAKDDKLGWTPIHSMVNLDKIDMLTLLLNKEPGAINIRADNGHTPLDIANIRNGDNMIKFLKARGAIASKDLPATK